MHYKIYIFILSIYVSSIALAMETPEEKNDLIKFTTQFINNCKKSVNNLHERLTKLETIHTQRRIDLKENLSKLPKSKEEKNKSIQDKPSTFFNNFNHTTFLIMSISFIAGYLVGSKSLLSNLTWIPYFKA